MFSFAVLLDWPIVAYLHGIDSRNERLAAEAPLAVPNPYGKQLLAVFFYETVPLTLAVEWSSLPTSHLLGPEESQVYEDNRIAQVSQLK